jgi:undecaprenyl diphosphate synthase
MDGNGRWARGHLLQRFAGHRAGVKVAREIITTSAEVGIQVLTLFAFSSENWKRPRKEVEMLLDLFVTSLKDETSELHNNNIRIRIIGDSTVFSDKLQKHIAEAEALTEGNQGMSLNIAVNYGGKWDILNAATQLSRDVASGKITTDDINEERLQQYLCLADLPEPDLFIRTGGEFRISNFLLWQLAYTELHFTDILWPDFNRSAYLTAIDEFSNRQRRFGQTPEQLEQLEKLGSA